MINQYKIMFTSFTNFFLNQDIYIYASSYFKDKL